MRSPFVPLLVGVIGLAACTETASTSVPGVPDTTRASGAEIRTLVEGGPYQVRIFDGDFAGTVGLTTWNFFTNTVSGSFRSADGETGTFSMVASVEGDRLCAGEGAARECHFIYPYENGFMEVTETGVVHAVSLPT